MAIPLYVAASQEGGQTDAGGVWTFSQATSGVDDVVIVQILQDGSTAGAVALTTVNAAVENLAGTDSALTAIGSFNVGNPTAGIQHLWIGRGIATGGLSISGTNSTSEDLYFRSYWYRDVSTGTTLATVIENSTAGSTANGVGTSTTCSDTAVTTLGPDRLALNFPALTDDLMGLAVFTGASGGTWTNFQIYESATGTDGTVAMETADMTSAGTIDGGSDTITSISWGVVGFALIGTTVETPPTLVLEQGFVNFNDPGVL